MLKKGIFALIIALLTCVPAIAADNTALNISASKPGAKVGVDRVVSDTKVVVGVMDAAENPIFGLGASDFSVTQAGRKANIVSVQPLSESMDVPRHIVLVLDNSFSMQERRAVGALLNGVGELLKIVRPIDDVQVVVFENFKKLKVDGREMSVGTINSSKPPELSKFTANAYSKGITGKTVLYDAMLAGLGFIGKMPEKEPRFMVVFSDGEDLNSTYGKDDVLKAAHKIKGFNAYAIDFMPGPQTDRFLSEFATENHGRIWKAKSENNLVNIFQEVASKMQYFYVVTYQFPPTGTLSAEPASLKFDEIRITGERPETKLDMSTLTLKPVVDSVYGIATWKVAVANDKGTVAEAKGVGAPPSSLNVELPTADLPGLAEGGDLSVKMELTDNKGQSLAVAATPVKAEVVKTWGSLTVDPSALRFDAISISGAKPEIQMGASALTVKPVVDSVYGIAGWKVAVSNSKRIVATLSGEGAPSPEIKVPLPTDDLPGLASGGDLAVRMELTDKKGHDLVMNAGPVRTELVKTSADVSVEPSSIRFDEVRVLGGAPQVKMDASYLTLRPKVESMYGVEKWRVAVSNAKGSVAELAGDGEPASELKVPLPADDLPGLAAGGDLAVKMEVLDKQGHDLVMNAGPVRAELVKTSAGLTVVPAAVTVEEIKTIDASPMLNHIYFEKGSSDIPAKYVRLSGQADTAGFDEHKFKDALEKYYHVLDIVGKRLSDNPGSTITLIGCNDNTGPEKNNKKLSEKRAQAVADYLKTVWSITPERMVVQARNLPELPSATRMKEGQAENRRVEIRAALPAILAPIQSTYITNRIDALALRLQPDVVSPNGIASWKVTASNSTVELPGLSGDGAPAKDISVLLDKVELANLAAGGDITVKMELKDSKGRDMTLAPAPVKLYFIQTSQRLASKEGLHVQEKYALILFDFDKATIDARNQDIVNRIVERAKTLPQATVEIVGHTDNIGKEDYNVKLSDRRALAVYDLLKAAFEGGPGGRVSHKGVGPNSPLYDNMSPEARSFNRTVTITLDYMSAE